MSDIAAGDTHTDYALSALRHEALRQTLDALIARHRGDGSLDPSALAGELRPLIEETLDCATSEDWEVAALCLIEEDQEALFAPEASSGRGAPGGRWAA
jgi:hypothetical protein